MNKLIENQKKLQQNGLEIPFILLDNIIRKAILLSNLPSFNQSQSFLSINILSNLE